MTMRDTGIAIVVCALAAASTGCDSRRANEVGASTLTADLVSIAVQSTVAATVAPVIFHVDIANPPASIYASISYSGAGVALASWYGQASTGVDITVQFPVPAELPPGVVTGQVRFDVCEDPKCDTPSKGSPVLVPVQLTVTAVPPLDASATPATISVTAMQGASLDAPLASLQLTFANPIPASAVVRVNHSHAFVDTIATTMTSPTTIDAVVQMFKPESFVAGVRTDALSFDTCYGATCVNHVTAAPIVVPLTYTIEAAGAHAEPGVEPFASTTRTLIPHGMIDADYSQALDAIVMVGTYPSSALYVYDVNRHAERRISLDQAPTAVTLTPDGLHAAVADASSTTYVDLAEGGALDSQAVRGVRFSPSTLAPSALRYSGYRVRSLSESDAGGEIAPPYLQLGSFVFHAANDGRKFLLSRRYGVQDPSADLYLSEF